MATEALLSGVHCVWQAPAAAPIALVVAAHGCRATGRVWFPASTGCSSCAPLPEESCISSTALAAGMAVLACSAQNATGCWTAADVPRVEAAVGEWRARSGVANAHSLPLLTLGSSSGGWFAAQAARSWPAVRGVCTIVSVPSLPDISPPLPRGSPFPPLQLITLQRDAGKLRAAQGLSAASWAGKQEVQHLNCSPRKLLPDSLALAVPGLDVHTSRAVHAALTARGWLEPDGSLASHPRRGVWRTEVERALPRDMSTLPGHSVKLAMDCIFQQLDVAYGFHAATCEHMGETVAFFRRSLGVAG